MDKRILRRGFTMVELLVVMAIVALLAGVLMPAIIKGRQKASVNKAKAELAGLASTGSMIYLDIGEYVRLGDYDKTDSDVSDIRRYEATDITDPSSGSWDGPYTAYQSGDTYSGAEDPTITANAPLDPWNKFYWLAYNSVREIMVIYSAGPDGTFSSNMSSSLDSTPTTMGTSTDDIEYCFK